MKPPKENPRWLNYARVHGRSSEEQIAHDRKRWPGGVMCGFILWNRARIVEFGKLRPDCFVADGLIGHEEYDAWLDALPVGHGVGTEDQNDAKDY